MSGPARAMLYRLALSTGLCAGELRHLTRSSLDFDKQAVTLNAQHTMNRTACTLPLRNDMALALADFYSDMLPTALLFNMPPKWDVIEMFKGDLVVAGVAYQDAAGRFADFHALRHTFITNLARSGVHPKVAQDLARHSDINLTMARYSHTLMEQRADAVAMLPEIVTVSSHSVAEGTTGGTHLASCLAFSGGKLQTQTDIDGRGNADTVSAVESSNQRSKAGLARATIVKSEVNPSNATLAQLVEQYFRKV